MMVRWGVISNANAGGTGSAGELLQQLDQSPDVDLRKPDRPEDIEKIVREFAEMNLEAVVAAGGDGTVNLVAAALYQLKDKGPKAPPPLAIIPLGTGNDLARSFEMPLDPLEAWKLISTAPKLGTIDVVHVTSPKGEGHFFNVTTGGTSTVVTKMAVESKGRWKRFAYIKNAFAAIKRRKTYRVKIDSEGHRIFKGRLLNIMIGNGRTSGGGVPVAPEAILNDGLVDVTIIRATSLWGLLRMAVRLVLRSLPKDPEAIHIRSKSLIIQSKPPITFSTDGETFHTTPAAFDVMNNALRVVSARSLGNPPT